ncbi:MAG: peptide ABC transporter permease [Phycisphaerae bacterium]|nr:MAG: peptide ABC transporter permease [Phycisphaerae bacterium]
MTVPTFVGIVFLTFMLIHAAPGSPVTASADGFGESGVSAADQERLRAHFELDAPVFTRFFRWTSRIIRFDFGQSFADGRPVSEKIVERVLPTLLLTLSVIVIALVLVIPIASFAAMKAGGPVDKMILAGCIGLYAIPPYVFGMILIFVAGVALNWFPFSGLTSDEYAQMSSVGRFKDVIHHSVLIGCCFLYPLVAYLVPFVRATMLAVLKEDFVRAAFARGLSKRRVILRHVLPNTLRPLLTVLGLIVPAVLGGSVVLEVMFAWPGMGRLLYESIHDRDYPVIMGMTILSAVIVLGVTLVVDLLCAWVDPRVRYA